METRKERKTATSRETEVVTEGTERKTEQIARQRAREKGQKVWGCSAPTLFAGHIQSQCRSYAEERCLASLSRDTGEEASESTGQEL